MTLIHMALMVLEDLTIFPVIPRWIAYCLLKYIRRASTLRFGVDFLTSDMRFKSNEAYCFDVCNGVHWTHSTFKGMENISISSEAWTCSVWWKHLYVSSVTQVSWVFFFPWLIDLHYQPFPTDMQHDYFRQYSAWLARQFCILLRSRPRQTSPIMFKRIQPGLDISLEIMPGTNIFKVHLSSSVKSLSWSGLL